MTIASFTDGTSSTYIIGEMVPNLDTSAAAYWALTDGMYCTSCPPLNAPLGPLVGGAYNDWDNWGFHSRHPGGGSFAWADGHVSFLSETINLDIYRA